MTWRLRKPICGVEVIVHRVLPIVKTGSASANASLLPLSVASSDTIPRR
jgi:hypothetical protein